MSNRAGLRWKESGTILLFSLVDARIVLSTEGLILSLILPGDSGGKGKF